MPWIALFLLLVATNSYAQHPTPVKATAVIIDTVTVEAQAVGSLQAQEHVIIRSELAGRIEALHFSEGQTVDVGEVLITLDAAEYEALLAESTATVRLNELSFERVQDLLQKNLTSRQNFDEVRAQLEVSQAQQQVNQVRLAKTQIVAPFSGRLGLRDISVGAYIQPGDDLITLVDNTLVKLNFRLPEQFLAHIHMGQTVAITVDAYPQTTFEGQIYAFEPTIDETTRTLLLRARVPNPEEKLYPGLFARVKLVLEKRPHAVLVPEQAIVPKGEDNFVFKIVDQKAVLTQVVLGHRRTGEVEIRQGLSRGDTVVTAGQLKLRDGAEVQIQ